MPDLGTTLAAHLAARDPKRQESVGTQSCCSNPRERVRQALFSFSA